MAKSKKYNELAQNVLELIGGKDNIEFFTHCVTRLRFNLKDKGLVDTAKIDKIDGVVATNWQGNQLQIIIGQSVNDAYRLIAEVNKLDVDASLAVNQGAKEKRTFGSVFALILDGISGSLTPAIPLLIGCGILKVIVLCLEQFMGLGASSPTVQILTMVGDAGFYFLPIIVGGFAARKFGGNQGLGMAIGAMLIYPTFVNGVAAGEAFSFMGIPIYSASYTSSIFPVIMSVAVMVPIQKFFARISPDSLRSIIEPVATLFVMIPIAFCVLGPAGAFLGTYMSQAVIWIYDSIGFIGVGLLAAIMPFLVMTGMHGAFVPYLLHMFGTVGYEPIFFTSLVISNINQGAAALAVAIKTKDSNIKSTGVSSAITAIVGGVTEPAMYGINLKYKTPMAGAMVGSAIAGLFAGLMGVYIYAFAGSSGLFAIPCFISENAMNVIWICVSIVIGMIATFATTFILYKEEA